MTAAWGKKLLRVLEVRQKIVQQGEQAVARTGDVTEKVIDHL